MAIFEKADYWGLKDPLEVRVQHKTLVLCAGHLFQPFGTKKSRRGWQEGPKLGIFEGTNIGQFWLFLAPPANPVDFLLFKMAGKGVPHIVLHVSCWTRTSRGSFRPQ